MIIDVLSWISITLGSLLGIIGAIGLHRFPDFYTRLHAAGTTDTLCAALFLLGIGFQLGLSLASLKLLLIFMFVYFTSPTASHSLANAAMIGGLKPVMGK